MLWNYRKVEPEEIVRIACWHGTAASNEASIRKNGFWASTGLEHEKWLGEGAYFFVEDDGCQSPSELAKSWSIAESFDGKWKARKYTTGIVLKAFIETERQFILDLRTGEDLRRLNAFRDRLLKNELNLKTFSDPILDGAILRLLAKGGHIKLIINRLYIRFTAERILRHFSAIPNCAVLCLTQGNVDLVDLDSIQTMDTFAIV